MATENKKAVRSRMAEFKDLDTAVLLEKFAQPMTQTEYGAIVKLLNQRKVEVPSQHGEVSMDEEAPTQRVIQIEELAKVEVGVSQHKSGMGALEWVSVVVGMIATILLWQKSTIAAIFYGLGAALVVYTIGAFGRRFWREMGTQSGSLDAPQAKRRKR